MDKALNMLPRIPMDNSRDGGSSDNVKTTYFANGLLVKIKEFSNLKNIFFRKLGSSMTFSKRKSSLILRVKNIVLLCSKEKMDRINTRTNIAFMENDGPFGDLSIMDRPGNSVGTNFAKSRIESVPAIRNTATPQPARSRFFHMTEESYIDGRALNLRETFPASPYESSFDSFPTIFARVRVFPRIIGHCALIVLLNLGFVNAGEVLIDKFGGLNTNDASVAIAPDASQDLLNVEITPGGTSVRKRGGYGLHKTLNVSTSAVHGSHYFQDINGSDVQLWGNDYFLNASVNGASPIKVATGTLAATWQCTDSVGYAYCVTSARDMPVRTAGTAATAASYLSGVPLGTMITATPDRLVVAGVSGNESTLYFSKLNTFPTFTTGVNESDGFTEVINSPGSRITHIRYACGRVLWWKDGSFGYSLGTDQYNLENVTISPNIGTLDNSSDEYNGNVYFRGQDSHIYVYDCANVTRLSRAITPTVQGANRRRSNSWTQNSQSEFEAGASSPTAYINLTTTPGSIILSSGAFTDTSTTDFDAIVSSSNIRNVGNGVTLQVNNSGTVEDPGGEDCTSTGLNVPPPSWGGGGLNCFSQSTNCLSLGTPAVTCTYCHDPRTGTYLMSTYGVSGTSLGSTVSIIDAISSSTLASTSFTANQGDCSYTQETITAPSGALGRKVRLKIEYSGSSAYTSKSFILGGNVTFYRRGTGGVSSGNYTMINFDDFSNGRSTIETGWFVSQTFNTGRIYNTALLQGTTVNTDGAISWALQTSSATNGQWDTITTSSGTSATGKQYYRYISTITANSLGYDAHVATITDVTVTAKSSATYLSAVNNATSLTTWDTFSSDYSSDGGALTFYVRASTGSFTVLSSTPAWYAQSPNATVNYATGTYMQTRIDFSVTSATQNPTVNDFSFNWFEGSASDKAYIKFWNDYVWVAVSSGTSGLNNRILRWDTVNQAWLLDDIPMNGMLVENNRLFFGSPTAGKVYVYDNSLKTDDSGPIESYWKSKDFVGDDPFTTNTWDQADFIVKQASGTFLTTTYTLDTTSSTVITLNLYDPLRPNGTLMRKGNNLAGSQGTFMNVKVGDDSSDDPWEVYGIRFKYSPLPWKPK